MPRKYLLNSMRVAQANKEPKHPLSTRGWRLPDGTIIVANSHDDVPQDEKDFVVSPSVQDYMRSNAKPPTMVGLGAVNMLTSAQFAAKFVDAFNAAGRAVSVSQNEPAQSADPAASAAPAAAAAPAASAAPAEPQN